MKILTQLSQYGEIDDSSLRDFSEQHGSNQFRGLGELLLPVLLPHEHIGGMKS